jgi:hypothetical protein
VIGSKTATAVLKATAEAVALQYFQHLAFRWERTVLRDDGFFIHRYSW